MTNQLARLTSGVSFLICCASAQCIPGKPIPGFDTLMRNQSSLDVRLSYDRTTPYVPGETFRVTIATTNSTASTLQILDPSEAAFYFDPEQCGWPLGSARSLTIRPGETIRRTLDSRDAKGRQRSFQPEAISCPVGPTAGSFTRATVNNPTLEVGIPVLEESYIVPVDRRAGESSERGAVFIWAVQLSAPPPPPVPQLQRRDSPLSLEPRPALTTDSRPSEHVLLITRHEQPADFRPSGLPGQIVDPCIAGSWTRLRALSSRITTLNATTDSRGGIHIDYATEDGTRESLTLGPNRDLIPVKKK